MHVDVHGLRADFEKEKGRGVAAFWQAPMISIEHGKAERAAVHRATVDQGDEFPPRRAPDPRLGGKAAQSKARVFVAVIDRNQVFSQGAAPNLADAIAKF